MNTNTASNRDWLAFNLPVDLSLPLNFVPAELSEILAPQSGRTEILDESPIQEPLLAYICEMAGTSADLDPAFEAAAIEGWLATD